METAHDVVHSAVNLTISVHSEWSKMCRHKYKYIQNQKKHLQTFRCWQKQTQAHRCTVHSHFCEKAKTEGNCPQQEVVILANASYSK